MSESEQQVQEQMEAEEEEPDYVLEGGVPPGAIRGCCQKGCLLEFPRELIERTQEQMGALSQNDKNMFIIGKLSTSIDLLNPENELVGRASKGVPVHYHFDKNYTLCRVAFETVFNISSGLMRTIRKHLINKRVDPDLPNQKGKPHKVKVPNKRKKPAAPPAPEVDPAKEYEQVRAVMKERCCVDECWSRIPGALISKTRIEMQKLTDRERDLFLLGKISHSVSLIANPATELTGGNRAVYVYDKDFNMCRKSFQYMHNVTDEQLRKVRFCLFENGISLSIAGEPEEGFIPPRRRSVRDEVEAAKSLVEKTCCKKFCLEMLPEESIITTRVQIKSMRSADRHMYIMGKLSAGVPMVKHVLLGPSEYFPVAERRGHCVYRFDKDHTLCKDAFHALYSVSASQLSNLKNHFMNVGISKVEHKLKGKPSNSRGKTHANTARGKGSKKVKGDSDGTVEVNEVEIENGSEEAEAEAETTVEEEAEDDGKNNIAYLIPAYVAES